MLYRTGLILVVMFFAENVSGEDLLPAKPDMHPPILMHLEQILKQNREKSANEDIYKMPVEELKRKFKYKRLNREEIEKSFKENGMPTIEELFRQMRSRDKRPTQIT